MPLFQAAIRIAGDPGPPVVAQIKIERERFVLTSGPHTIGDWPVTELNVTHKNDGVHLAVEGEELVIDLNDPGGLVEALAPARRGLRIAKRPPAPKSNRLAEQWRQLPARVRHGVLGVLGLALITIFLPNLVGGILFIAGLVAVLVAGMFWADQMATTKLPWGLSPAKLLVYGAGLILVGGFLILL
jgi:hypothetical protein